MKSEIRSKLDEIFGYPFFDSVGRPPSGSVTPVNTWEAAIAEANSARWENCRLMARNALQRFTERRNWHRSEEWNPLANELRPLIVSFVQQRVPKTSVPQKSIKTLESKLSWDIMLICFEYEYRDVVKPLFYVHYSSLGMPLVIFRVGGMGRSFRTVGTAQSRTG